MANLFCHFKPTNCPPPALRNMMEPDLFVEMAETHDQAAAKSNRLIVVLEQRIRDALRKEDFNKLKQVVTDLTEGLKSSKERESQLTAELKSADSMVMVLKEKGTSALAQVAYLIVENQKLIFERDALVLSEVKAEKEKLVVKYTEIFASVKSKFDRKALETNALITVQEVQANLDLLEELVSKETTVEEQILLLKAEMVRTEEILKAAAVSEFSLEKLVLPDISEASVGQPLVVDARSDVMDGLNPFGSNMVRVEDGDEEAAE